MHDAVLHTRLQRAAGRGLGPSRTKDDRERPPSRPSSLPTEVCVEAHIHRRPTPHTHFNSRSIRAGRQQDRTPIRAHRPCGLGHARQGKWPELCACNPSDACRSQSKHVPPTPPRGLPYAQAGGDPSCLCATYGRPLNGADRKGQKRGQCAPSSCSRSPSGSTAGAKMLARSCADERASQSTVHIVLSPLPWLGAFPARKTSGGSAEGAARCGLAPQALG